MKNIDLLNTENGLESTTISKEEVNNSNLYLDEKDSKGVPILLRIEKYPDLPEDEFIPVEYPEIKENTYKINKKGELKNEKVNNILSCCCREDNYIVTSILSKDNSYIKVLVHRLVAFTFLINPDKDTYKVVNHIDHNPKNNNLSNLEWVTTTENGNKSNGKCNTISEERLVNYVALDDNNNEIFRITRRNNPNNYNLKIIVNYIKHNRKYQGYYWKIENKIERHIANFSGKFSDYIWLQHWKYPELYICSEGFIKTIINGRDKILYSIDRRGYVIIGLNGKSLRAHRVIMEFLLKRDLKENEIVDHINTIRNDNRFSNLRVTNSFGNMNNNITIEKKTTKVVMADLCGNFICFDSVRNIQRILNSRNKFSRFRLIKNNLIQHKYIFIDLGDKESLYKKMENVVYVFSKDKTKLIGAYSSIWDACNKLHNDRTTILKYMNTDNDFKGKYYMKGVEAVKLVLSLGYGNAVNFKL